MKKAVILFNLGGPNNLEAVQGFLFNLFYDKAIIQLPNPLRYFIAKLISSKRAIVAKEIYKQIGNKSPILEETEKQAVALQQLLQSDKNNEWKVFISMRYWHPFSYETIEKVKEFSPDEIVLLPLYPQFSTTTTLSSFKDWHKQTNKINYLTKTTEIPYYYNNKKFILSHVNKIRPFYEQAQQYGKPRLLFSAHGLPEKVIKQGDPYQKQVEESISLIVKELNINNLDYIACYQSRVGPLKWIGPSTEDEIKRAGKDNVPIVLIPIAFVSEHSETMVELDIEYKHLAHENGVTQYLRVPTLRDDNLFIEALAECLE